MVNKRKAEIIKKFILSYYKEVDIVDINIHLYTQEVPLITVYFRQDEPARNMDIVLRQEIKRKVKFFLGYNIVEKVLFPWESRLIENQNPVARIECISINVDSFDI